MDCLAVVTDQDLYIKDCVRISCGYLGSVYILLRQNLLTRDSREIVNLGANTLSRKP